jgi:hypothetical protein
VSKKSEKEALDAKALRELRDILPPGSTVWTVLRHSARSGMYRAIDCYALVPDKRAPGGVSKLWLSPRVARVCGYRFDERREAIGVGGAGMDMGFAIVQNLYYALHGLPGSESATLPEGMSAGYTLRHEWI